MARLGVNKDYLKKRNRGLVLQLIATGKCTSRIELAREVHLTKTAISAIVNELIEQGYLREAAVTTKAKLGRTPVKLEISPEAPKYIGILFGRGCLEAAICDLNMNIIAYERVEREEGPDYQSGLFSRNTESGCGGAYTEALWNSGVPGS